MSSAPPKTQLCAIDKTPPNDQVAIATLKDLFEKQHGALSKIAAKHLTPDRLARIAVSCVSKTPRLLECTPQSILSSVMAGAAMGLEAGGPLGHGYLVPRFNGRKKVMEATFLPGYRGLIDLARRSGHVLSIEADVVYEADDWTYNKTEMGTMFAHVPSEANDPGLVLRAYAVARLKDSPVPIVIMMPRREIEAIRTREKKNGDSPWDTDYAEMAKKSAIRRIVKYLPMSIEMANCLDGEADDERDIIDVTPATVLKPDFRKKLEPKSSPSLDHAPEPSEPEVDTSESQELPEIEPIADVLRGIEALRTDVECAAHSEVLKAARWESEEDRKQAAAALKARWKVIIDEVKSKSKPAAAVTPPAAAPAEPKQQDLEKSFGQTPASAPISTPATPALISRCDECGLLKGHDTKCSKKDDAPKLMGLKDMPTTGPRIKHSDGSWMDTSAAALEGDEIQGREREPGMEG